MDQDDRDLSAGEIERRLLAAICAPGLDDKIRAKILERLAMHEFASADHAVILQALVKMPRAPAQHIRETLRGRLTRLGFPDIDVEPILELEPPSAEQIGALLRRLSR
jgi:hypothetical protein